MKINAILNEQQIIKEQILNERTYREFYALGMLLQEYAMTQQQIQQLFQQVADGAAQGGNVDKAGDASVSNRTMLGKGADAAAKVAAKWDEVKNNISKSAPVAGFDAAVDTIQSQLIQAAGGEQGTVSQAIQKYRDFAHQHPVMQGAIYAGLVALAGISGAGLGGAALLGGIKIFDRLLQGDKASSALWKGFKTGAVAYGAGQIGQHLQQPTTPNTDPTGNINDVNNIPNGANGPAGSPTAGDAQNAQVDVQAAPGASAGGEYDFAAHSHDYTVKPGDNLSTILDKNHINPELAKKLNPELFGPNGNPNVLQAGQTIRLPDADALKDMQTMIYTGPGNQIGQYHGQYEPGNPNSLDATSIQKQIDAGRYGSDNGMAAQRIAQDAGTSTPSSNANGAGPSLDNMGQRAGTTPEDNPIYVKQAPPMAPADGTIDPKTGYVKGNPWGKPGTRAINSSYKNPNKLIREHAAMYYIDRETTARRWVLNEQLGRARGSYYLTPRGVAAVFKGVEAQYLNEGPMLDKLKSFNQKASSAIGKFTAPIKQAAAAGWDSATNKITARDLDMNWRRSAKLDKEASVDSAKVVEFLKKQGVKNGLIDSAFAQAGLQAPSGEQQQGQMTQQGAQLGQQQGMPIAQTSSNTQNIQSTQTDQSAQSNAITQSQGSKQVGGAPQQDTNTNLPQQSNQGAQQFNTTSAGDNSQQNVANTRQPRSEQPGIMQRFSNWRSGTRASDIASTANREAIENQTRLFMSRAQGIDPNDVEGYQQTFVAWAAKNLPSAGKEVIANAAKVINPNKKGTVTQAVGEVYNVAMRNRATGVTPDQTTKTNTTQPQSTVQPQNVNPGQIPNYANPQSQEYVGRREASRRMSAAQQTTQSTTPNFGGQQQSAAPSSVNYNLSSTTTIPPQAKSQDNLGGVDFSSMLNKDLSTTTAKNTAPANYSSMMGSKQQQAPQPSGVTYNMPKPTTTSATPTTPSVRDKTAQRAARDKIRFGPANATTPAPATPAEEPTGLQFKGRQPFTAKGNAVTTKGQMRNGQRVNAGYENPDRPIVENSIDFSSLLIDKIKRQS